MELWNEFLSNEDSIANWKILMMRGVNAQKLIEN